MPTPKAPPADPPLVRVRYIGAMPEVDVPTLGLDAVKRGDVVEVTAEAAGSGPFWRPLRDDEEIHPAREYRGRDGNGDPTEVRDLGSGLLSQLGNWEPADDPAGSPASDAAPKAKPGTKPQADATTGGEA